MEKGRFVISLDFELLWGVFDKVDHTQKENYFKNTRRVIPELLSLFKEYDIHVTWATVGMLFNKSWEEWMQNIPEHIPNYDNIKLSAYDFGRKNRVFIDDELCFANELIDSIIATEGQEMATHTYSHYYCLEKGQEVSAFQADLEISIKLARTKNIEIKSLVFPRNQFNSGYLDVCVELGITGVRINPDNWYWRNTQKDSLQQKIFRTGDAYLGFNDKSYPLKEVKANLPVQQKASRLLRPKGSGLMNRIKLDRIFKELEYAAKNAKVYHLWWHPHNFGDDPAGNFSDLKRILNRFKLYREKYGMVSNTMEEISKLVLAR